MLSRDNVKLLGQAVSTEWPIVSFYLRIDKERIDDDYTIRMKNLLREAVDDLPDHYSHDQRQAIESDLERIREFLRDEGNQFGRGIAIFVSSNADLWQVFELPKDIESRVYIGARPLIAPLIGVLDRAEPTCICLITRDQARILYQRLGTIEELETTRDDMVPGQHDQGGWSQGRYERHIEEHVRAHFNEVAGLLYRLAEQQPYRHLVLGGPDEVVSAFLDELHPYVRDRHSGTIHVAFEANVKEIAEDVDEVISTWQERERESSVEILRNEAQSRDRGVAGVGPTIDAIQGGQVMTLVIASDFTHPGSICTTCYMVQPETAANPEECVYDGGPTVQKEDIVPDLISMAFLQDARVMVIDSPELRQDLAQLGSIGALLRFSVGDGHAP